MRIAAVQHDIVWEDPSANFARLGPMIAEAASSRAQLVVLSEMFSTGFSIAAERIAEAVEGPSERFLREQAARHHVWVCGSIPQRRGSDGRPVNQFVLAGPDGAVARYAKLHPFSFAGEHEHYASGDETITVEIEGVRVTPFVCYDLRFADDFWAVGPGTDVFVVVANWPEGRRAHWQALLTARAIENQAYVVGVNRVGSGDGLAYAGDSRVIDPMGETLAGAAKTEMVLVADVHPAVVRETRERFPFLADRRAERATHLEPGRLSHA